MRLLLMLWTWLLTALRPAHTAYASTVDPPADPTDLDELIALRGQSFDAMDTIVRSAMERPEGERDLTDEEVADYDRHEAEYNRLDTIVAERNRANENELRLSRHDRIRRASAGPLIVMNGPEPVAASRTLDELLHVTAETVPAGTFDRTGNFHQNAFGARNPVEAPMVMLRSGELGEAPRITEFAPDQAGLVRRFQRTVSDMILFGLLVGRKGQNATSEEAFRFARTHPKFADRWAVLMRAMDVDTAAEGGTWIPTGIGASVHEKVRAAGRVGALFPRIPLPTNPWKWPLEGADLTAYRVAEPTGDAESKFTASTAGTGGATFDAEIFGVRSLFSRSLDADSAIAILPYVTAKVSQAFADGEEKAIIDGDTDGTHQDSDVGASTTDARTAWDGLRKKALASGGVDGGNNAITVADLRAVRARMGKWGLNPSTLAIIVGVGPYFDLLSDTELTTVDKFGPNAVVLNGQLGAVDGIPVIASEHVREDLNAAGVHDGVTTNRSFSLIVNRGEWAIGERENLDVEVDDSIYRETYQRLVVGFQREDFQNIGDAAANTDVELVYNIT